jgi:hypothetical protein
MFTPILLVVCAAILLLLVLLIKSKGQPEDTRQAFGQHGLTRRLIETVETPVGDWRWTGSRQFQMYRYWCKCGAVLESGPCGGAAVNAVCKTCRINYGNLPGFEGEF